MPRLRSGLFSLALLPLAGWFFYHLQTQEAESLEQKMLLWEPRPATLKARLEESREAVAGEKPEKARLLLFFQLFQQRYRDHEISIGVRGPDPRHLVLLTPANYAPWEIKPIALALWSETRTLFNVSPDIDIYATFIGAPIQRVAELRPLPSQPDTAHLVFHAPIRK